MRTTIAVLSATVALSALLSGCHAPDSVLHVQPQAPYVNGIAVTGQGKATSIPDIARVELGIEVRHVDVAQATEQANARMRSVLDVLTRAGLAQNDLRTSNFSISYERMHEGPPPPPPAPPSPPTGARRGEAVRGAEVMAAEPPRTEPEGVYRVTNMVVARIRDLTKVGDLLGQTLNAGANNVWGISFELDDPMPLEQQAREKAIADARARAEQLAKLSGLTLGPIMSINDEPMGFGPLQPMAMRMEAGGPVPVEAGEVVVVRQVQVIYALPARD